MAKKNAGRSKIIMEKKADVSGRQVTFSKRRKGLEKKASELVTLTGSEVATIIFSPGGKVFSFGHPSVDTVVQRFLGEEPVLEPGTQNREKIFQAHQSLMQNQTNFHLNQINELVDAERRRGEEIDRIRRKTEGNVWWERPIEEMSEQQLESLMVMMREFKRGVLEEARLLQQEQELNGGLSIPVPSNVMGGGADGGPVLDPKGKGIADELPNTCVSFDPRVDGSRSRGPLQYPTVQGFDGRVPPDPSTLGAGMGFNWMSLESSSQVPLDPMMHGFSDFGVPEVPILGGYDNQGPVDPNTGGKEPLNGMSVIGSSSQVPPDSSTLGFYRGAPYPYDPMEARSSGAVSFDQMEMGFDDDNGLPFNLYPFGFQDEGSIDRNATGPSNGGDNWSSI